ncbi:kinase-like domain-containing protein [Rhizophagus clarus]|uniref:Kinase-like domain-containing protein n=1 Tax=Rhizophagus clarus TaxID=94130 RepID=A0A8H3QCU1_9GLOM|nr:kinase-like domain-containing protein [Rhizophagus clarus]
MVLMAIDRLKAIWTNGYIIDRDNKSQKWIRKNQNIIVEMKRLNNPNDITVEFMKNKISKGYGNTQLSSHDNIRKAALEWIPYNKFYDIEYIARDGIASHNKIDNNYIIKFYGITQDPHTKNYIMVLKYAESGSLRNYFDINHNKLDVDIRINYLFNIACGLESIHKNELIHRDLHIGA